MDEQDKEEVGKVAGGLVGAMTGARIGSIVLPIPVVGPFAGALAGGVLGTEIGKRAGRVMIDTAEAAVAAILGRGDDLAPGPDRLRAIPPPRDLV